MPKAGARSKSAPAMIPTSNPEIKLADPVHRARGDILTSFEVRITASDAEVRKVFPVISGFLRMIEDWGSVSHCRKRPMKRYVMVHICNGIGHFNFIEKD
jgi:hypothetical protein